MSVREFEVLRICSTANRESLLLLKSNLLYEMVTLRKGFLSESSMPM